MDHWRVTLKPAGEKMVWQIHDRDFNELEWEEANRRNIRNRNTRYWRGRIRQFNRERERVPVPTESWEIGHRYEFTRWEPVP